MEKEAKKEAYRKYLESNGVLDALTKVLVALYEQNDKPESAIEFVQQKLGGPSLSEYEKLQTEISDLRTKYDELLKAHQETCLQLEELKSTRAVPISDSKDDLEVETVRHEEEENKEEITGQEDNMSEMYKKNKDYDPYSSK